jgi:hypothetical protein
MEELGGRKSFIIAQRLFLHSQIPILCYLFNKKDGTPNFLHACNAFDLTLVPLPHQSMRLRDFFSDQACLIIYTKLGRIFVSKGIGNDQATKPASKINILRIRKGISLWVQGNTLALSAFINSLLFQINVFEYNCNGNP